MHIKDAKFLRPVTKASQVPVPHRPSVIFAGRSNSGKSSLINMLVQRKSLARTSNTPGRTQEIVYFEVNEKYYFVDLPGYGYAKVPEAIRRSWGPMMEAFIREAPELKIAVIILDSRRDPKDEEFQLSGWLTELGIPWVFAATKTDKMSAKQLGERLTAIEEQLGVKKGETLIPCSIINGKGRREIMGIIMRELDARPPKKIKDPGNSSDASPDPEIE